MGAQAFTDEEVAILEENKYTAFVSNSSIRFTLEFKQMFMERKQECVLANGAENQARIHYAMAVRTICMMLWNMQDRWKRRQSHTGRNESGRKSRTK